MERSRVDSWALALCLTALAAGCSETPAPADVPRADQVPVDAASDRPATDATVDAAADASDDASTTDASPDAAPDVPPDVSTDVASPDDAPDASDDVACLPGQVVCGGSCTDLQSDPANCGACATRCAAGQTCAAGACACPTGQTSCGGACVDTQSDPAHCGACGAACADRQTCAAGACACAAGLTLCSGQCVDPQTSPAHCGACGRACATNAGTSANACAAGACSPTCAMSYFDCNGDPADGCEVDARGDAANCGACGRACATNAGTGANVCVAGACSPTCAAGFADCDGDPANGCEADTRTSGSHCGACGRACAGMTACSAGACVMTCPAGATLCTNQCVALASDPRNCGRCGAACAVARGVAACAAGACSATAVAACDAGFGDCDRAAANGCEVSTNTTAAHCGRCGAACPGGHGCQGGRCVPCGTAGVDCPPALTAAVVQSNTRVLLRFSEPLDAASAAAAYFSIAPSLAVTGASFGATRDLVLLDTAAQANNTAYTVTARRADTNGDSFIDGRDALVKDVAGNPIDAAARTASFVGMGAEVYAITDVIVTDNIGGASSAYTGLASGAACVGPYVPGETGSRLTASDVNIGIGGSTTGILVRYARVRRDAATPVLTGITAQRWANWNVSCPAGYVRANGTSRGIQGALSTGTDSACWRIGLCVRYEPVNAAATFVTNLALSVSADSDAPCAPFCRANDGSWSMARDALDLHRGCGDGRFVHLCVNRAAPRWPPMPARLAATDAEKLAALASWAPRIYTATGERYNASSVEWAWPNLERFRAADGRYWLRTRASLPTPSDTLPFFAGDLATAPIYAYWADKTFTVSGATTQAVDLIYYAYYPYNRGKEVLSTVYGNHVGDWEHVSTRLTPQYDFARGWSLQPDLFFIASHDFGELYRWADAPRSGTHPVVYAAWGSHGMWSTAGRHVYQTLPGGVDLVDDCSAGPAWDTWNRFVALDYFRQAGLGGATWPRWMGTAFDGPGAGDPANPGAGAIYRWGNTEQGCVPSLGVCRLENGPTGPVSKGVWGTNELR
ncbi:MAG: MXAN_6577-like cysteine-rich protein [Polyangiales bacterium]